MKEIENIVKEMDIPSGRISDLNWLSRNLGIRNASHPRFDEAMQLIKKELTIKFQNK